MNRNQGLILEELVTVYPDHLRSIIQKLPSRLPERDLRVERLKLEEDRKRKELEEFLLRLLWGQLRSMGLFGEKNPAPLPLKFGIELRDWYDQWLKESIVFLAGGKYLENAGESCSVTDTTPVDRNALWKEWDRQKVVWLEDPGLKSQVVLAETTLRALPEILTGKRPATDVLFPDSSMELVQGIYRDNEVAAYFNETLAGTVAAYIEERLKQEPSARISIFEIGAGTGGSSAGVFRKLKPYRDRIQEYCYSDLSKAFLMYAHKEYGPANPYLTYQIFNVEAPVAGQGINAGGYDLVIAANVLHATANILHTLRNAKAILKKNGLIILNEINGKSLFTHLTFGLLEGWWLYEDPELRIPGSPGLSSGTWKEALESEGFRGVFFPAQEAHSLGQQIIIAESDGMVRQKQPPKTDNTSMKRNRRTDRLPVSDQFSQLPVLQDHFRPTFQKVDAPGQMHEVEVRELIIEKLSESLKVNINAIDADDSFADYGVDSITGVHLVQVISQALLIELETTSLFNYSSVNQLTAHILSQYGNQIASALGDHQPAENSGAASDNGKRQPDFNEPLDTGNITVSTGAGVPPAPAGKDEIFESPAINRKGFRFAKWDALPVSKPETNAEPVAVVGISGVFPMARDLSEFWRNLMEGKDCVTEIPEVRWDWREYFGDPARETNKTNVKWGGFIDGVSEFDPLFFGISPQEAELMDPQQRLFLMNCWRCIEDAGINPSSLSGSRCGVFVGCGISIYKELLGEQGLTAEGLLGNVSSILAARISYFLNLKGPSLAIDTGCSSALVAIAEACNGLRLHTCDLALAGGVSVSGPSMYITSSDGGMLSPDGRCFTFDVRANGFIPGEGAGVILLKRLSDAVRDRDPICGVICGWGTNQDGKTNGITAPSVSSQILLQKEVYQNFGINPETITLVETHGAATVLGDPIEVEALTESFQSFTGRKNYCALGTVKSNIGHLLAAAGAAGIIKVLLALRYRMLPPTLHYETLNNHLSLHNSPFYINTRLRPWEVEPGIPRRAGINSFGFSGTNVHLVIEEYLPVTGAAMTPVLINLKSPLVFVLSAQSQDQLTINAARMKSFVESQANLNLMDMAYTLQVGREAMDYRLAFVADSKEALLKTLTEFISGAKPAGVLTAQVKKSKSGVKSLETDEDAQSLIQTWIRKGKLLKVAEIWVDGLNVDWNKLYDDCKPRRISLPTYPFAGERYWISKNKPPMAPAFSSANQINVSKFGTPFVSSAARFLHPLAQENTSDLSEQRFSSVFTGREFFFTGDGAKGQRVLSKTACLEMARAAVWRAAGGLEEDRIRVRLQNVVWGQPVTIEDQPVQVHIRIFPERDHGIFFEIYTEASSVDPGLVIHSQGGAVLSTVTEDFRLDLQTWQTGYQCNRLSSSQYCEVLRTKGIEVEAAVQGIEEIYPVEGQVLAKLALPSSIADSRNQFVLHPSLMDSALLAAFGLMMDSGDLKPVVPFALQELDILGDWPSSIWVFIRPSKDGSAGDPIRKLDFDFCDEQGTVRGRIKGLETTENSGTFINRSLPVSSQGALDLPTEEDYALMTFEEVWAGQELPDTDPVKIKTMLCFLSNPENQQAIAEAAQNLDPETKIIFISQRKEDQKQSPEKYRIVRAERNTYTEVLQSAGKEYGEPDALLYLWPFEDPSCIRDYSVIVYLIQAITAAKLKTKRIFLAAQFTDGLDRCYLESWIGFERSLGLIMPNTRLSVIFQENGKRNRKAALREWLPRLWAELQTSKAQSALYLDGKRLVCQIRPVQIPSGVCPVKAGGTYLITGGCGGLGFLFAKYFAKTQPVNLILTGRSPLDAEKKSQIKVLEDLGSRVRYLQADVSDRSGMKKGLDQARELFGGIHGVIHAAGLQDHQSILHKEIQSFNTVLDPKIKGTLVLDELLDAEPLDFVCYFSSFSPILGDFGACNYSIANRFLMAYGHYRSSEQASRKRPGKTIVINWPVWKEGGMASQNDENIRMLLQSSGQRFLEAEEGLAVFDRILAQSKTQVLVAAGQPSRVQRFLGLIDDQPPKPAPTVTSSPNKGRRAEMRGFSLEQCLEWDLKDQISILLKIPPAKLDRKENLAGFGFNSINLTRFAASLSNHYGMEITPAVFYGYPTLQKLIQYFLDEYPETITEFYREDLDAQSLPPKVLPAGEPPRRRPGIDRFVSRSTLKNFEEPIAIIGMSGRFPQARNVDEMWRIIAEGRDVVQEIPADRFDWRLYYGDPAKEPGKINCKWCGCIPGVREFDPLFFEISPKEAEAMDPRQRLLLQEAWKALEDAGYGANQLKTNKTGMFVGVEMGDYQLLAEKWGSITANLNSILAARLAYFLNLNGPVMAIDTACSSGLVATHQACSSLRNHECDTAIAAGVNLFLAPDSYVMMSQAGMLSEDGMCHTFDKKANGMVPGEGVAVVVLKRLSRAERDGDPIYAVIRGNGINYDGKTNGISAPSGVAQTSLLKTVYDQYQINPEEIEYVVAHGTGTKLGDPIEVNALYEAFKEYTKKTGFCALTSTKTNFGHTFSPSGIISLISLVQAFRHETIPASLHCEEENDFIRWKESPFYVNKANRPWPKKDGKIRTGAVSAFGMSGTNVHLVVQRYETDEINFSLEVLPYYLLVFSAKSQESLEEKVKDLMAVLQNKDPEAQSMLDVSYTLLEGRQHFNHRLAVVIRDREDAIYVLNQAISKEKLPNLCQGKVPRDFTGQKALEDFLQDLLKQSRSFKENQAKCREILHAVADLYCQGYEIDGNQLYGVFKPRRIHLPAYPFAREHYWVPVGAYHDTPLQATIHPLLHQNTSDLSEQRFSSNFTGRENFLADYAVMGQRVMPGAVYLELARAAVEQSTGALEDGPAGIRLKNVVWAKPVAVGNQAVLVHIGLYQDDKGEIAYEIYSRSAGDGAGPVIHGQGNAAFFSIAEAPILDLQALQAECHWDSISSDQCYEAYRTVGINYGPWYQGIETVYVGPDQILARISLLSSIPEPEGRFALHPRMIEAAFQASIGFLMKTGALKPACPLRLQELEIYGSCTSDGWVLVRSSEGRMATDRVRKFDIDLCDPQGRIWARLKGLELNSNVETMIPDAWETTQSSAAANQTQEEYELLTFEEVWQGQALPKISPARLKTVVCFLSDPDNQQASAELASTLDPETKLVFISQNTIFQKKSPQMYQISIAERKTYEEAFRNIREDYGEVDALLYLWPLEDSSWIRDYSGIVYLIQAIAAAKLKIKRVLLAAQFAGELERCYLESWIGFERSLGLILPNTHLAVIHQKARKRERETLMKEWLPLLWAELGNPQAQSVLYQDGQRLVSKIRPTTITPGGSPVRTGGTYLITGGCGGLGLLFAGHFAKTQPVNLILTGRSPLDAAKQSKIKVLEELGSRVRYLQVDVCDRNGMREGLKQAKKSFGGIHGVIHAAGIVDRQGIHEKEIPSFQRVLEPKIKGTLVLDELLAREDLDFLCYFSSSSAILGDFGSCDYAIANRFLMAYAFGRNQEQLQGKRSGKTVVINWPLWQDGGLGMGDDANTKMYLKSSGLRCLEAEEGIALFDRLLSQNNVQHLVLAGYRSRVNRFLGLTQEAKAVSRPIVSSPSVKGRRTEMKGLDLPQCVEWDLKEQISQLLKISRDKLEIEANLGDFGFDSIYLTELAVVLTKHFGIEVTPALFYSHPTIQKLTQWFFEKHQPAIQDFYQENRNEKHVSSVVPLLPTELMRPEPRRARFTMKSAFQIPEPIAIIGMSGRFPQARNIEEMWTILVEGREAIREIPAERFDWRRYYGDPMKERGKTNCKWCGSIPGADEFDPLFFEISPKEAVMMDPRQRLLLQEAWRALEDAGYGEKQIRKHKIGMFVGVEEGDYKLLTREIGGITSHHTAILAARLSYFLNLSGPNMAINTACSSGLVAAHQACLSLRNGECDAAIAAGVNLVLAPEAFIMMSEAGMLSEDGKCYTFDKRANGMVPGEAVAVVVLKRLSQAKADGDPIYAVINGSGINYDGKTNGITAPSGVAQTSLIKAVYDQFQVNPEEIEYIVTHGTGTKLGDPIEVNALYDAFKDYTKKQGYAALTSTKTNFGHTFATSGLVSLISLVQAFRHGTIPGSLHCEEENDYINWKESPFYVNKTNRPWPNKEGRSRTGAVSAFGMSGTNAHMVVQSFTMKEAGAPPALPPYYLLVYSAKTQEALAEKIAEMITFFQNHDWHAQDLSQISYTLLEGRRHFTYRCAMVIQDREDALHLLRQAGSKERLPNLFQGKVPRDFTGQKVMEEFLEDLFKQSWSFQENQARYRKILSVLADLYCQGYEIDGDQLCGNVKPRKIHLPAYPFMREHYWVSGNEAKTSQVAFSSTDSTALHPLLQGNVRVKMKGFLRTPGGAAGSAGVSTKMGTLILQPYWKEQAVSQETAVPEYTEDLVLFYEPGEVFSENTETLVDGLNCRILRSPEKEIPQRYQFYVTRTFEEIQRILKDKTAGKVLVQIAIPNQGEPQLFTGLSGLLKTARLENPKLIGQLIEIEPDGDSGKILNILKENRRSPNEDQIRYQDGKRWILDWKEVEVSPENPGLPWRDRGVYLITGGAGGLGVIFAKEIARQVKEATLILTGRSSLREDRQKQLQELETLGAKVIYQQVDVTDHEAVQSLMGGIGEQFRSLNGIIHSAGVIHDNYILKKTSEELQAVLAPKVAGLVNLDQASKDFGLDFFVLFSSSSVCSGNPGQADYVCANAFMDAYAKFRNALVASKQRKGQTLSINWPLWKEGGMSVDQETRKIMWQKTGMIAMETLAGVRALYQGLAAGQDQVMVLEGDLTRMREYFLKTSVKDHLSTEKVDIPRMDPKLLRESTLGRLKVLISEITKLEIGRIDPEEPLESYGIDSIMITQLNQKLAGPFAEFSKTLFYEYQTLGATAEHLTANYPQECLRWAGLEEQATALPEVSAAGLDFHDQIPGLASGRSEKKAKINFRTVPSRRTREPIAIIGMSGRFSQAKNLEEYWENLKTGKDCITEIPEERWSLEGFFDPDPQRALAGNKSYCKWGAFLEAFNQFDPLFFNISPREAENIDPQVRLFLEECWKAFEDAGYAPSKLPPEVRQKTGVFGGITKQGFPVTSFSSMVNRVSYFFNLQGPSIPIDTMCSSSLVAIHEACEYIREGKGDLAVAGGVNLYLRPDSYIELSMAQLLSTTARSLAFEKGGAGFVPGEGVGVIILKAYDQAIRDGDQIHAVIRGTAVNHNGKTNGYLIPNPNQQTAVIQEALDRNKIDPRTISYLESAANGSEMGDAIEMTAIMKVFGQRGGAEGCFRMGSVKPNIGHCEAASGISQLMKVVLSLKHQTLVPTLHSGDWNPNLNFNQLPFQLQQEVSEWKPVVVDGDQVPRRAGITSIGAGGVNAHIIVEEYLPEPDTPDSLAPKLKPVVFILSAKNKARLEQYVKYWIGYLQKNQNLDLERITYTLQTGREEMPCRLAIVTNRREDLIGQLEQWLEHRSNNHCCYFGDLNLNKILLQEAVSQFMKTGNRKELAKLWVLGNSIPWPDLYHGKRMLRLAQLPSYPFERMTCWKGSNLHSDRQEKSSAKPFTETGVVLTGKEKNEYYTETERTVAEVWGRELGLREINVYDKFLDLGGNSIIAVKLEVEMGKKGLCIENSDLEKYPSVAEIAQMISRKSNHDRGGKKTLKGIAPFNALFYRNCFYNALFPVIKFFSKEITFVLVNDVAVYTCPPDQAENLLTVLYKSNKGFDQLLNDRDIKVNVKLKSDEIVKEIISGISQDRPVIIRIDCYYAPIREDLYQKEHWEHCWLVYGYDQAKQTFNIIEHRHRGSLTYKMYEVSYRDLENSYSGYLRNLHQASNEPTFFEFYLENTDNASEENLDEDKKSFAANMLRNKDEILEGLKEIKKFEASFQKIDSHDQEIAKNVDRIIEMLNEILNARKADLYKIKLLFNEREDLAGLLDKVIKGWDFIRLKLARCMYTSSYDRLSLDAVTERLANMYRQELDYHLLFFSFLEETNGYQGKVKSV